MCTYDVAVCLSSSAVLVFVNADQVRLSPLAVSQVTYLLGHMRL